MLTPTELEAIGIPPQERGSSPKETENPGAKLRLDGIIYQNDDKWCIWLDGQRFSKGQHPPHYKVVKVSHDRIEVVDITQEEQPPLVLIVGDVF